MANETIQFTLTYKDLFKSIPKLSAIQKEYQDNKLKWCKEHGRSCADCKNDLCPLNTKFVYKTPTIH